jgi:hypothetical protein
MTNAIEQAKREMYERLGYLNKNCDRPNLLAMLESSLESYLELLRQDHEALHETARKRFEDIQALEMKNDAQREIIEGAGGTNELSYRLAKMTEERDAIQLRLHAVDHAYKAQQEKASTSGQTSGDRASCKATEANAEVIRAAARNIQLVITDWGMGDLKAKKAMRQIARIVNGDGTVGAALGAMEKPTTCMHSFFAIGQDQMKCTFCGVGK